VNEPTREEALIHFGVKGMKWGQRKMPGTQAMLQPKSKPSVKNDATGKTNLKALEMDSAVRHLQMVKTGAKKAGAILGIVGSVVLAAAISGRGTQKA